MNDKEKKKEQDVFGGIIGIIINAFMGNPKPPKGPPSAL